jgi:hypothetical protein
MMSPSAPDAHGFPSAEWSRAVWSRLKTHKTLVLFISGLILLAALCLLFFYPGSPEGRPSESITRIAELKLQGMRVEARLQRNRIEDSSSDLLQVDLFNGSEKEIREPRLHLSAPGFSLGDNPRAFSQDQRFLPCVDPTGKPATAVPARSSCRFAVNLAPACLSGVYGVTVYVDWAGPDAHADTAILLAPITIDRAWRLSTARFARAGRRLSSILKDLAVPIMLAVLGALFAAWQSGLEASRLEAEREQSERQEVGRLLLTRILDLARMHYLPFVTQATSVLNEAEKNRSSAFDSDFEKLFYHFLLLLKRMEVFRLTEGGIFFKRRDGEMAMTAAWFLLKTASYRGLGGDLAVANAMKVIEPDWDYAAYKTALPCPAMQAVWKRFQAWRKVPLTPAKGAESFWQILGVMDAFQAIASFEGDTALQYWYEKDRNPSDPNEKLFRQAGKTLLYRRKDLDPQDMAGTLEKRLKELYQRDVQVIAIV